MKLQQTIKYSVILCFLISIKANSFAQGGVFQSQHIVETTTKNGDTTLKVYLPSVYIISMTPYTSKSDIRKYSRLERRVQHVYPYALLAGYKLRLYNDTMQSMTEAQRKKYMKKVEKELKADFGGQLKNLSMSEGKILIRLIDRETGNTSYALVKQLRGAFSAFFWQSLARLFGDNLKTEYNPETNKQDEMIERIIYRIDVKNGWPYTPFHRLRRVDLFSEAS